MNTFILSHNPFEARISPSQLETFIKDNRKIYQWYTPFAGTYILKSEDTLASLAASFRGSFDGAPFLISNVLPSWVGGAQSPTIWTWFNGGGFNHSDQVLLNSTPPT